MAANYSSNSSVSSTESSSTEDISSIADRLPNKESYFYQQIGAPTFLYKHDNTTKHAAEYFPSIEDSYHSWKPWNVTLDDLGIVQIRDYANYITETLSQTNRARLIHNFPGSLGRAYDNLPYVQDSNYGKSNYSSCLYLEEDEEMITNQYIQQQAELEMKKRHNDVSFGNSFPLSRYCAPFTEPEVRSALGGGDKPLLCMSQKEQKQFKQIHGLERRNIQEQPQYYGNSLKLLPCNCQYCEGKNKKESHSCALLFSKGQSVSVNPIHLPQKDSSSDGHGLPRQVDVEATVMQIESCCDVRDISTLSNETLQIVRTSRDVSILLCEAVDDEDHAFCTRDYTLSFIASLDYHIDGRVPLTPIDIATRQYNSTFYGGTIPTFATVCKSSEDLVFGARGPNTIHYTTCGGKNYSQIQTKRYEIENLSSISQIEFSGVHPLVLWSAARSSTQQPLIKGPVHWKRPQLGYGHSLHSIDLRSNKANFVWSPSDDEFVPGGIHSVCSIVQESHENPYSLFVSTASAGSKLYHIDARMPSKTICSWSMGGMLDEDKIMNSSTGIYGAGSILTTPLIMTEGIEDSAIPIINGKKEPNAKGFSMHYRPKQAGLFHTKNLESVASTTKELDVLGTFSKTSFHPFPTTSSSKFTTGLASFYTDMSTILTNETMKSNEFDVESQKALCVITADSRGDILSNTFAVCGEGKELQMKGIRDAPLGSTSVSLKGNIESKKKSSPNALAWQLSKIYARTTNTKTIEEDLPPSQYAIVDVAKTSTRNVTQTKKCRQNFISYEQNDVVYGSLNFKISHHELPLVYHNPKDPCDDRPLRKRKYKIKEPSENIIDILAEVRKKRAPKLKRSINEHASISSKIFDKKNLFCKGSILNSDDAAIS
ncbi:hypothetical protein CTEN210_00351 [Chaetoceros tenuissimus]|uniref:Uncharacterized protein n=1 Tax=Chaetoceros tenuissimus TaxID=426638 RepID=A0AAD3GYW1_9STRA|nr:hypothetical protein CTEN210_00351 [Chaetoceros tenuissimus]